MHNRACFWKPSGSKRVKNDIMYLNLFCIYEKPIILSLFKIDTLNVYFKRNKQFIF